MRLLFIPLFLFITFSLSPKIMGQGFPPVKEIMSLTEFRETGLFKLSEAEMKKFNEWLESYSMKVFELASSQNTTSTGDVIESKIEGVFEGWDGDTIFKLTNGQIWQQTSYAYTYHYAYRPEVLIIKTDAGYKMKVDGISESIYVKRIK